MSSTVSTSEMLQQVGVVDILSVELSLDLSDEAARQARARGLDVKVIFLRLSRLVRAPEVVAWVPREGEPDGITFVVILEGREHSLVVRVAYRRPELSLHVLCFFNGADQPLQQCSVSVQRPVSRPESRRVFATLLHPRQVARGEEKILNVQLAPEELAELAAKARAAKAMPGGVERNVGDIPRDVQVVVEPSSQSFVFEPTAHVVAVAKATEMLSFLVAPAVGATAGPHQSILLIKRRDDSATLVSDTFSIQVTDLVFGISRSRLGTWSTAATAAGGLAMFVLTFLGKLDVAFGYATGTAGIAIASALGAVVHRTLGTTRSDLTRG